MVGTFSPTSFPGARPRFGATEPSKEAAPAQPVKKFSAAVPEKPQPQGPSSTQKVVYNAARPWRALQLKGEYLFRIWSSRQFAKLYAEQIDEFDKLFEKAAPGSPAYLQALQKVAAFFSGDREIEVNVESGRIADIAKSDESCIFVMNHDYQSEDPSLLAMFTMLLYQEYLDQGRAEKCPLPKILLNRDILTTIKEPKLQRLYERLGAIGVDARVGDETVDTFGQIAKDLLFGWWPWGKKKSSETTKKSSGNGRQLVSVFKSFNEDQSHIFLFPEGRMAAYTDKPAVQRVRDLKQDLTQLEQTVRDVLDLAPETKMPDDAAFEKLQLEDRVDTLRQRGKTLRKKLASSAAPTLELAVQVKTLDAQLSVWLEKVKDKDLLAVRFQEGISGIISTLAKRKKRVKVVPLGFAFNVRMEKEAPPETTNPEAPQPTAKPKSKKEKLVPKQLGSVYVGEPVYFDLGGDGQVRFSPGNVSPEDSPKYAALFQDKVNDKEFMRPLKTTGQDVIRNINAILCENMTICKDKARDTLPKSTEEPEKVYNPIS